MTDIYVGDIFGNVDAGQIQAYADFEAGRTLADFEAAIGGISVGSIEGYGEVVSTAEPIPDPVGDAVRYEKRRVGLGRAESLLTGGLGVLGAAPISRPTLLGRRL